MPLTPLTPLAVNFLLWFAGYNPVERNAMYRALPIGTQEQLAGNDYKLMSRFAFPEGQCTNVVETIDYFADKMNCAPFDTCTMEQWTFQKAVGDGAREALAQCHNDSRQTLLSYSGHPTQGVAIPWGSGFSVWMRRKAFSREQATEYFATFTDEARLCLCNARLSWDILDCLRNNQGEGEQIFLCEVIENCRSDDACKV